MSKREAISRNHLIIKKLRRQSATFDEIHDYLALESEIQSYDLTVSKRTFQRDLNDIRSIYNIDIQYDFSRRVYYIDPEVEPEVSERILEAFDTFNALNITDRLSDYIHFETRKPQGTENLYGLLHAIRNQLQITFSYYDFWEDEYTVHKTEPYALKEFRNRWYILAYDLAEKEIERFALDRISQLEFTKVKFQYPQNFNVNEYYKNSFGIIGPDVGEPEEVILSFEPQQGRYIKSLPLHNTQEILVDNEQELQIKLILFLTYDFEMEIRSFGENVKVIHPEWFADNIKTSYELALKQYK